MSGDDEVWLHWAGSNVVDRVIMPTRDAKALEAWFYDPAMVHVPANITPAGETAQVLHRSNYRKFTRKAI